MTKLKVRYADFVLYVNTASYEEAWPNKQELYRGIEPQYEEKWWKMSFVLHLQPEMDTGPATAWALSAYCLARVYQTQCNGKYIKAL
jgi:hypothetical protein